MTVKRVPVSKQKHERNYLKKKYDITGQAVAAAQRAGGLSRAKVEAYILNKRIGNL